MVGSLFCLLSVEVVAASEVTPWPAMSAIAMAAISNAFTAVFSDVEGSGIDDDSPATEIVFMLAFVSAFIPPSPDGGDSSDPKDGIEPTSPLSVDCVLRGFSATGDACFKNA